jgi:FG-GAP repeat protein
MKTKSASALVDHCVLIPLFVLAAALGFAQISALAAPDAETSSDGRTLSRLRRRGAAQLKQLEQREKSIELLASDGAAFDAFGWRVAVDGDTALVGAYLADVDGRPDEGAAYIFRREPTSGAWTEEAKLTVECDTVVAQTCGFGTSVAMLEGTALIGAPDADPNDNVSQGAAYVFVRDPANGEWTEEAKLVASDGAELDQLGIEVALAEGIALVGAPFATVDGVAGRGAAYLFERDAGSGTWVQRAKFSNAEGDEFDGFGAAVSLSGQTALVGEPFVAVGGNPVQGVVHVFERDAQGSWTQQAHLVASDGALGDDFGAAAALSGDVALIGARGVDVGGNAEQGAAYIFTRDTSTGAWTERAKLFSSDGTSKDFFASHVGLSGDIALIGAPTADAARGVAYVFEREPESEIWSQTARLDPPTPEEGAGFGTVAIADGRGLIGAPRADVASMPDAGAAYLFTLEPTSTSRPTPTPRTRPTPRPRPTPPG